MMSAEAYIMPLSEVTIKAHQNASGERIVEVQASSEARDDEGDVILQSALLDSADSFVKSGHLDIDHYSEIGHRIGIKDPASWIIGRPLEVKDIGGGNTSVVGEIMRAKDGSFNPENYKYDSFWKTLQSDPPVRWLASIYGFPQDVDNCSEKACSNGATRYLVKSIRWQSLAFTRKPINTSLKGFAKIVTAKSFVTEMVKDYSEFRGDRKFFNPVPAPSDMFRSDEVGVPETAPALQRVMMPMGMNELWGMYQRHIKHECMYCEGVNSVLGFTNHFMSCCGYDCEAAELYAHALMYMILKDRKKNA